VRREPPDSPVVAGRQPPDPPFVAGRQPGIASALGVAALLTLALCLLWFAGHKLAPVGRADLSLYRHFRALSVHPAINWLATAIVNLCNSPGYELLCAVPVTLAMLRRRPWLAVAMVTLIVGATLTTEILKAVAGGPLPGVGNQPLHNHSWPSGHTTAAMALSCCLVAGAPRVLRGLAIALGVLFTVGMAVSVLVLSWHYATDAVGGVLVAGLWSALLTVVVPLSRS
jgi:membrane-associated phospholipid phosphatase